MEQKYYAGIGSRQTPPTILKEMTQIAGILEKKGYILRSGGAEGADSAFEKGVINPSRKEILRPKDCKPWALEEVKKYIPSDRPPFERMKSYVQQLLGRNMQQVLGIDGETPINFLIAWTPDGKDSGGSGYALRCAKSWGIPIYNLYNKSDRQALLKTI
jgi:hypothetical protein